MSDIKNLLEKMDSMTAAERKPTGPKWPGYWKGTDSAKKSRSRMVGSGGAAESVEESENFLKELDQVANKNPVKKDLYKEWNEFKSINEYGAPGSAIGNDTATNPNEVFAANQERKAQKAAAQSQIADLSQQLNNSRAQIAAINRQFPQGANPVEKAMSLKDMSAQRNALTRQIEDLTKQIAALRQQAI